MCASQTGPFRALAFAEDESSVALLSEDLSSTFPIIGADLSQVRGTSPARIEKRAGKSARFMCAIPYTAASRHTTVLRC